MKTVSKYVVRLMRQMDVYFDEAGEADRFLLKHAGTKDVDTLSDFTCKSLIAKMGNPRQRSNRKRKRFREENTSLGRDAVYYPRNKYRGECAIEEKTKTIEKLLKKGWTIHGIAWKVVLPRDRVILIIRELGLTISREAFGSPH